MTTTHTSGRGRHDWGSLLAGLVALTVLTATVLLTISLAPASAETPAERCKRETNAYNNAWKNSWAASHPGKKPSDAPKPPVPYKCGGNNDGPPPTVQPTTTAPDAPANTLAPTTDAPSDDSGPSMNAPTTRRDLEHPEGGQPTIGRQGAIPTTRVRQDASRPESSPKETDQSRSETSSRPPAGPIRPNKAEEDLATSTSGKRPAADVENYSGGPDEPISDPAADGCLYCTRDDGGNIKEGPANSDDGWSVTRELTSDCPDGTHKKAGFPSATCWTDYDYNIVNVRYLGIDKMPGSLPIAACSHPKGMAAPECSKTVTYETVESLSTATENSVGGSLELQGMGLEGGQTTSKGREVSLGRSSADTIGYPADRIPEGYEVVFYQRYNITAYQIQKVDTMTGQVVSYTNQVSYVPIAATTPELRKIGEV